MVESAKTDNLTHALYGSITLKELIELLDNWHEALNYLYKQVEEGNIQDVKMCIMHFVLSISRVSDILSFCGISEEPESESITENNNSV